MKKPKSKRAGVSAPSSRIRRSPMRSTSRPIKKSGASSRTPSIGNLSEWSLVLQGTAATLYIHFSNGKLSGSSWSELGPQKLKLSRLQREFLGVTSASLSSMYNDSLQSMGLKKAHE